MQNLAKIDLTVIVIDPAVLNFSMPYILSVVQKPEIKI